MRVLELFSGTCSVGRIFKERGHDVLAVDCDPKTDADEISDILAWDYRRFEPRDFDVIWASPPCTQYSICRTSAKTPRDLEGSDRLVARTLEIIRYLQPRFWFMENPQTGLLKTRDVVRDLPFKDVTYCSYGLPYRKKTRLWTNCVPWIPRPTCDGKTCPAMEGGTRHKACAQGGYNITSGVKVPGVALNTRYAIPRRLVEEICDAVGG